MHILFIPSWYPTIEHQTRGIFFKEQAIALRRVGVDVGVVSVNMRSLKTINLQSLSQTYFQRSFQVEDGLPTFRFSGWSLPSAKIRHQIWLFQARLLIRWYIKDMGRPDLIHAHGILWGGVIAREMSKKLDIPFVITEHSSAYAGNLIELWQRPHITESLREASRVIAVSHALAKEVSKYTTKSVEIIPNVVDTSFFTPPILHRPRRPFTFLVIASLTRNKRIDFLVKTFTTVFLANTEVKLVIGGDGPEETSLRSLVNELGIGQQVSFLGRLSRAGVRDAMLRANAFVIASHVETFGVVAIEAMATGLPVISTRCGGPEDIITCDNGLLVSHDEKEMAQALLEMYTQYDQFDCQAIVRSAKSRFEDVNVATSLKNLYEDVLT